MHGCRWRQPIGHRMWDIPTNVPDIVVSHVHPCDPESFRFRTRLRHLGMRGLGVQVLVRGIAPGRSGRRP